VPNTPAYLLPEVVQHKSTLTLKIIVQNMQTLQLFTINIKQKLFTKDNKNDTQQSLGLKALLILQLI